MASITERQRTIIDTIEKESTATRAYLRTRAKPLTAYQHYIKHMRARWNTLSEEERDTFMLQAKLDRERYENEKAEFMSYTIEGPVDTIELFNKAEKQKLIEKGVPEESIGIYKSVGGNKFNWRAAKRWGVTVYGGSQNYRPSWGSLRENYDGKAGRFTTYTNYKGESWTENH